MTHKETLRVMPQLAARYFFIQGLGGFLWWLAMAWSPRVEVWFSHEPAPGGIHQFLLADLVLFAGGSLLAAWALHRGSPSAAPICWTVVGATAYATLICLQSAFTGVLPTLCAVLMIPCAMLSLHCTLIGLHPNGFPFRVHRGDNTQRIFLLALAQTGVFYAVFFGAIPWLVLRAQEETGWPRFVVPLPVGVLAGVGFLLGGTLAIGSTAFFARAGKGTPLPTSTPGVLVTGGPYAHVRNPMAVGGIFQGLMVGLALGSVPVMLYSLTGAVIWHLWVRPVEEADLCKRFGDEYASYQKRVRCWWPRGLFWSTGPRSRGSVKPDG